MQKVEGVASAERKDFVPSGRPSGINAGMNVSIGGRGFSIELDAQGMMGAAAGLAVLLLPSLLLRAETTEPVVFTQSAPGGMCICLPGRREMRLT